MYQMPVKFKVFDDYSSGFKQEQQQQKNTVNTLQKLTM